MDLQKDLTHENDPDPGETAEWLDALKGALAAWGEEGPRRVHHLIESRLNSLVCMANICRFQPIRRISIRFHSILSRRRRATRILSAEFARIRAGMRWLWCCAPEKIPMLAGISRRLRRARRCTKPALITSGARHPKPTAEI